MFNEELRDATRALKEDCSFSTYLNLSEGAIELTSDLEFVTLSALDECGEPAAILHVGDLIEFRKFVDDLIVVRDALNLLKGNHTQSVKTRQKLERTISQQSKDIKIGILTKTLDQIKPGVTVIDIDEELGEGIVRQVGNGWVVIKWNKLGNEWGTPLCEVVDSLLKREWILLDQWCSELTIPGEKQNV